MKGDVCMYVNKTIIIANYAKNRCVPCSTDALAL